MSESSEVVLVVEDDPITRLSVIRALRREGYYVLEATNGEDALHVMQEYHAPVHILVTDVVMPEMNGAELVTMLRQWYPLLKAVIMSGYGADYLKLRIGQMDGSVFLSKPFTMEELCTQVRHTLDTDWIKL